MRTLTIKVVTEVAEFEDMTEDQWMEERIDEIGDAIYNITGIVKVEIEETQ